jgi:EmrB/QacA subfamily drug resistance transporter
MALPGTKSIALFIAVLAGFITPFDLSAVTIALPAIAFRFCMDAVTMGWVSTAYLLASAVFLVPFGRIADIYGRKKVFLYGLSVFTTASLLMIMALSPAVIILFRVMQGMGAAMIFGTSVAILTSVTPTGERGRALGIYITSVYIGLSAGPFLGGLLTTYFGWQSIFLINIPLGLATIAVTVRKLNGEWTDAAGERFDLSGSLLYGLALVTLMFGFSELPLLKGIFFIIAGTLLAALFIFHENRTKNPLLDIALFAKNRVFAFSNLAALINYSATFAVTFFLSLYLQYIHGLDPAYAGAVLVAQPVVQALFSAPAGRLSDRINSGTIASYGMALTALGLIMLTFITPLTPLSFILLALVILGLGFALFSSPNTNAIMGSVDRKFYGVASGTLGTMRLVGQMLSMGMAMMIIAVFIGRVAITPGVYDQLVTSIRAGFALFSVLCLAGIYFSLARNREKQS